MYGNEYYRLFADKNGDVYEKKFRKIDKGNITWNWCAFLVPVCWFLYRKLYSWFFIFWGISSLLGCISLKVNGVEYLGFGLMIAAGLFGDKIYKARADKYMPADIPQDEQERTRKYTEIAAQYGGTSKKSVLAYIGICIVLAILGVIVNPM